MLISSVVCLNRGEYRIFKMCFLDLRSVDYRWACSGVHREGCPQKPLSWTSTGLQANTDHKSFFLISAAEALQASHLCWKKTYTHTTKDKMSKVCEKVTGDKYTPKAHV